MKKIPNCDKWANELWFQMIWSVETFTETIAINSVKNVLRPYNQPKIRFETPLIWLKMQINDTLIELFLSLSRSFFTEGKKEQERDIHTAHTQRNQIKSHWKRVDFKCLRQLYDVRFFATNTSRFFFSLNADKF